MNKPGERPWTPEQDQHVDLLRSCGLSWAACATAVGRSKNSLVGRDVKRRKAAGEALGASRTAWTDAEVTQLADYVRQGLTDTAIAHRMRGRSPIAVTHKRILTMGDKGRVPGRYVTNTLTPAKALKLKTLWAEGVTIKAMARVLGLTPGQVAYYRQKHQLPARPSRNGAKRAIVQVHVTLDRAVRQELGKRATAQGYSVSAYVQRLIEADLLSRK